MVLGSGWLWGTVPPSLRASLFLPYQPPLFTHDFCPLITPAWTWPIIIFQLLSLLQTTLVSQPPNSIFLGKEYEWSSSFCQAHVIGQVIRNGLSWGQVTTLSPINPSREIGSLAQFMAAPPPCPLNSWYTVICLRRGYGPEGTIKYHDTSLMLSI